MNPSAQQIARVTTLVALGGIAVVFVARIVSTPGPARSSEPDASAAALFEHAVVPVLDHRCGNCHGLEQEAYERIAASSSDEFLLRWPVDPSGRITSHLVYSLLTANITTARWPIDLAAPAEASPFIRAPLSAPLSNSPHAHPEVFSSVADPDYRTLVEWIDRERSEHPATVATLDDPAARFFAAEVMPVLSRKTCLGANCHGPFAFNDLRFDPGIPVLPERYTPAIVEHNRQAMLGVVARLVHLTGDLEQSKQLLKNIPVREGGIVHKGGNDFFRRDGPDYRVLLAWLKLEAEQLADRSEAPLGEERGLIFVRRPRDTPERFFESDSFMPGAQLVWRHDGRDQLLSEGLANSGAIDIRAPDVSYDARRVAFALRRGADEPFNLWEIDLDTAVARQLTFSTDARLHFMEPLYVPDPDDEEGLDVSRACLVMTSNHQGEWARSSPEAILGEAEGGSRREIRDDQLTERAGTLTGRSLTIVRGTNTGATRRIVAHTPGRLAVDRPFRKPCDSSTHYAIEATPRMAPRYDGFRMRLAEAGRERETFAETLARMTFTVDQVRRPTLRSDGSPMFTFLRAGWQNDRPFFNGALFRLHVDGSDFHPHHGNRSGVPIHSDDRELPNGLEVRIGRDADSYWGGMLMLSDHQFGVTIEADNPLDDLDHPLATGAVQTSAHRFVPGWISLDPGAAFKGVSKAGAYRDPYPLPDGSILVSHAAGPVDLADPEAAPNFDILRLVPNPAFQSDDGFAVGNYRREVVVSGPTAELWPRPVVVRPKPPVHKKLKTDPTLLGPLQRVNGSRATRSVRTRWFASSTTTSSTRCSSRPFRPAASDWRGPSTRSAESPWMRTTASRRCGSSWVCPRRRATSGRQNAPWSRSFPWPPTGHSTP